MRLSLVEWEECVDLRSVSWNVLSVERVVEKYNLHDGEGVLYTNAASTKFRIVAVIQRMPILLIPPVASSRDALLGLFLTVSMFVRKLSTSGPLKDRLNECVLKATEREHAYQARVHAKALANMKAKARV